MLETLEGIYARFKQVELLLSSPEVASDMKRFTKLNKEYSDLKQIVEFCININAKKPIIVMTLR